MPIKFPFTGRIGGTTWAPRGSLNHVSSRHSGRANLTFLDGHACIFQTNFMASQKNTKVEVTGVPDINWSYDGTPSQ